MTIIIVTIINNSIIINTIINGILAWIINESEYHNMKDAFTVIIRPITGGGDFGVIVSIQGRAHWALAHFNQGFVHSAEATA